VSTLIKQKTVDVAIDDSKKNITGNVVSENQVHAKYDKVLRLHFSLAGETAPNLSDLSPDYSYSDKTAAFRYDWSVGVTAIDPCYTWNWWEALAVERAFVVQLLIDPGESDCGVTELATLLLALQPSKDTSSWLERHAEKIGNSLSQLSDVTESFSKTASGILKASAIMSNFVSSDDNGQKNWFIYRFLDEKRKCPAVEWNIHRNVLHRHGSLLRGSILLAFHGNRKPDKPLTLLLRPRLCFGKDSLNYLPEAKDLEQENPVALSINPVVG
jgi:hypothetical protein